MGGIVMPTLKEVLETIPQDLNELRALEARLKPTMDLYGSVKGFMGENEHLMDIIVSDYETLVRLNITYQEIRERLDELMLDCDTIGYGEVGHYKFAGEIICGEQNCPWKDGQTCNQYVMWLVPKNGKKGFEPGEVYSAPGTIEVSGLLPHLIGDHYFFEGMDTPYRLDPEQMVEIVRSNIVI